MRAVVLDKSSNDTARLNFTTMCKVININRTIDATCKICGCIIEIPINEDDRTRLDDYEVCSSECLDYEYNQPFQPIECHHCGNVIDMEDNPHVIEVNGKFYCDTYCFNNH